MEVCDEGTIARERNLARYRNDEWQAVGASGAIDCAEYAQELIAIGTVSPQAQGNVLAWNGTSWRALSTPRPSSSGIIYDLVLAGDELWACGGIGEPVLNAADFACFLQRFGAADPRANCDRSTVEPVLNIADFTCFLGRFAAGCPYTGCLHAMYGDGLGMIDPGPWPRAQLAAWPHVSAWLNRQSARRFPV